MEDDEDFPPMKEYGPMTREETIDDIKERRSRLYYMIFRSGPILTYPKFWAGYAKVIDLWVEESEYRGFFRPNERTMGTLLRI